MRILLALLLSASSLFAQADYSTLLLLNQPTTAVLDYPLDDTATNAYAAWSSGRVLSNAWTGSIWLAVRSSDGATNYFTGANKSTLDSWAGSDDVYLTNWFDQTGNGRTLLQGNTNLCPRVYTNGVAVTKNGYFSALFDRGDYMSTAALAPSLPISYLVGVNNDARTSGDVIFSGNSATRTALKQGATAVYRIDAGSALDSADALTLDQWESVTAVFTSANDSVQVNAGTPTTGTAGNTSATALLVGFPTTGADMALTEVFVWNALMPDADGTGPVRTNMVNFYSFP